MIDLRQFRALTFDCYGTLVDWEAGLMEVLEVWAARHGLPVNEQELLTAFAEAESFAEAEYPQLLYPEILKLTLRRMASQLGVPNDTTAEEALAGSVGEWPPFSDTSAALERLQAHYKLAILSNVDRASFARTNGQLGIRFDLVMTAEDIGSYKPAEANFRAVLARLESMGIGRGEVLHVAQSLYHDHVPAKRLGLHSVWIDRRRGRAGSGATPQTDTPAPVDLECASLRELAEAADRAFRG